MPTLFLTGYEGETIESFVEKLEEHGITSIVDIREIPLSRKNGFSKVALEGVLNSKGIKYYHYPRLGSPTKIRKQLHDSGDYLEFFKEYRNYVTGEKSSVKDIVEIISENKNPALLCFEKLTDLCHRSIVASEILKLNPKLKVTPL